jgi:hypothetical protein
MRSAFAGVVVLAVALALGVGRAGAATHECNGLQTCVPIAGPWVLMPVAGGATRPHVEFQLSCPRNFIVGGIDVELSDRAIDVAFLGRSGSPVNPGITTERAAVFVGTYVGVGGAAPSFRPHLGCIPASGGGARVPTVVGAVPVGKPVVRRTRDVPLAAGSRQVVRQGCAAGERLVGSSAALGFYTDAPPSARLARAVAVGAPTIRGGRVKVVARAGRALGSARAMLQVGAVCAGGT